MQVLFSLVIMVVMLKEETVKLIKDYFSKQPSVLAVYLYGSQATGLAKKNSDIDLAVLFDEKKDVNTFILQGKFDFEVERLSSIEVDIQNLNACDAAFVHRVLSEGKLLYKKEGIDLTDFQIRTVQNYFDLKPTLDQYYLLLSERARRGLIGQKGI